MVSRVSSTVTKRKANPRPRKYASASERQAAYRARAPEVCFRAEAKTVETLDRIADTLDQSRADVLLSMTKFALANHDWARFGLTHKPLPFEYGVNPVKKMTKRQEVIEFGKRMGFKASAGKGFVYLTNMVGWGETFDDWDQAHAYLLKAYDDHYVHRTPYPWDYKENPMKTTRAKRKPTPAQLAARERFAEMARNGAFKKAGKRKKNPDNMGSYGPFYGDTDAPMTEAQIERKAESYMDRLDRLLMRNEITPTVYNREVKALDKWTKDQYAKRRKTNPAKKTVSQKISQLTREGYPQKQAVAIALNEERAGKVRRNPSAAQKFANPSVVYQVQHSKDGKAWEVWGTYMYLPMAKDVANRRAAEAPREYVRVESIKVKA